MLEIASIVFVLKGLILTEVLTNAARTWGIFDEPRKALKKRIPFFGRLLDCFECTSIWAGTFVFLYLRYFEWDLFTAVLIFHRAACFLHAGWDVLDWTRAHKEQDFSDKVSKGE